MAEGLFNAMAAPGWRADSAGTEPAAQVRPEAITVMREIGIDISGHRPKHLRDALGPDMALVIGLCQEEACPGVPGGPREEWQGPNPARGPRPSRSRGLAGQTARGEPELGAGRARRNFTMANGD